VREPPLPLCGISPGAGENAKKADPKGTGFHYLIMFLTDDLL